MKKPLGKATKAIIDVVIYVVIVGGIVYGLPRFLSWYLHTPYPMAAITSGSMWPVLKEGDLVFIHGGMKKEDLHVGDVVVWRDPNGTSFVIHRIVELGTNTLTTKGDANFTNDSPVPYANVVGRAVVLWGGVFHVPYLGSVTTYASKNLH